MAGIVTSVDSEAARAYHAAIANELVTEDVIDHVAAGMHSLVRSWSYDVETAQAQDRYALTPIDPWPRPTTDPAWVERGETTVDVANTSWEALPCDWRARFRDLATVVAGATAVAVRDDGRTPSELDEDDDWMEALVATLARPWLREVPRVTYRGGTVAPEQQFDAARWILLRGALRVQAALAAFAAPRRGRLLGHVPDDFPQARDENEDRPGIMTGGQERRDRKHATFRLLGPGVDPARIGPLQGVAPSEAFRAGDLRLDAIRGEPRQIADHGRWALDSGGEVDEVGPTLEAHVVWLLDRLEPHATALRAEQARDPESVAELFCFWSMEGVNADFSLSPGTLARVAALGAQLRLDVWSWAWDDDEEEDDED
jgi:hypothetical protein